MHETGDTLNPTSTPIRSGGKGYIDEQPGAELASSLEQKEENDTLSGSSVEEDGDTDVDQPSEWSGGEGNDVDRLADAIRADLSFPEVTVDDRDYIEQSWDVEDEDWELAHGDFTKQYNRLRQQHAAVQLPSKLSSSGFSTKSASSSRPPLPARNINTATKSAEGSIPSSIASKRVISSATSGVVANPKSSLDRHDKDKSDRATLEQVLDSRTRLALSALVKRGTLGIIERCISTGKEANVYLAQAPSAPPSHLVSFPATLAVKVYRTSILNFRSRQEYIEGEHRFRGEYTSAKNPRKMVKVWAEKELRNLRRLEQGGVRAPRVVEGKENVLLMEFLGDSQNASPRLKDAEIPTSLLATLYLELLVAMRRMFHHCKLVHADLSEYNILLHDSHLYIIDVSQSVERDHPRTFDFLRTDIRNINDFFARRSVGDVQILGIRRTWDFIVSDFIGSLTREEEMGEAGESRLMCIAASWLEEDAASLEKQAQGVEQRSGDAAGQESISSTAGDEAVFMSSFIPRSLAEVFDPERDFEILKGGDGDQLIYAGLTGLESSKGDNTRSVSQSDGSECSQPERDRVGRLKKVVRFEGEEGDETSNQEEPNRTAQTRSRGFRHEGKEAKKTRKQAVKEEKREKRRNKMPKAEKARLVKQSSLR